MPPAKNDWHIAINNANVPKGASCAAYVTGTNDHVVGTVEWDPGSDPGFTWKYSYDSSHWTSVSVLWHSPYVVFDFFASDGGYSWGHYFEIKANQSNGPSEYYCGL